MCSPIWLPARLLNLFWRTFRFWKWTTSGRACCLRLVSSDRLGPDTILNGKPMRILVDSCVAEAVVEAMRNAGHDVEWVPEWGHDPGDESILQYAHDTHRVLVTRDKDFGALVFRDRAPHHGLIRIAGEMTYSEQSERTLAVLAEYQSVLETGGVITIEEERVRVSDRLRAQ